ncbi:lipoprotein insertase outer membrane protein LolB [Dongshaea marina]|uniref:lipoprotein insertase outer membrane protein LolB n=1 Tax=Dongshaea marina TaxID=2047966 RepID=UPI00131F4792|nr:lipoprotein insertase outer membrane protein LolB [Dongshaea marina]
MTRSYRLLFTALCCLLFAACSSTPPTPTLSASQQAANWKNYQKNADSLTDWTLRGKLALITPDQKGSLNLFWQNRDTNYKMVLSDFFGRTILTLQKINDEFYLTDNRNHHYQTSEPEALIYNLTGLMIPLQALPSWVKGVPLPQQQKVIKGPQGLPATFVQGSWQADFQEFMQKGKVQLPQKLKIQEHQEKLTLKLAIYDWSLHA